jgi:hypothetical protein
MTDDPPLLADRISAYGVAVSRAFDLSNQLAGSCGPRVTVAALVNAAMILARSSGIDRDDFAALMAGALSEGYPSTRHDA